MPQHAMVLCCRIYYAQLLARYVSLSWHVYPLVLSYSSLQEASSGESRCDQTLPENMLALRTTPISCHAWELILYLSAF